jgi:homoserine dehydrogenase
MFSEHGVSVEAVQQSVQPEPVRDGQAPTATLVIGTHEATESALAATVAALTANESVAEVTSVLRVEGN